MNRIAGPHCKQVSGTDVKLEHERSVCLSEGVQGLGLALPQVGRILQKLHKHVDHPIDDRPQNVSDLSNAPMRLPARGFFCKAL